MDRRPSTGLLAVAVAVLAAGGLGASSAAAESPATDAAGLRPGDVLDSTSWKAAEGLLPPEVLRHYRDGEYTNRIDAWPADKYTWPTDFLAGSKANAGRYGIGKDREIVDATTGVQPDYVIGFPFPDIDPRDPDAGAKVVWNFLYRTWYFGTIHAETQLNFVSPKALQRRVDVNARFMYYDGVPTTDRVPNPNNLLNQTLVVFTNPSDVQGTAALTWRYRDADQRDSTWTYAPAIRRVRQVSPANRSDGFLGSDLSPDDGPFFDGKAEDFDWTLVGESEQLRYVDPLNLAGKSDYRWQGEGKGWRTWWPDLPSVGYMDPGWKGIAWAPTAATLAKRRFWIVEGVPKDRYYLYGKLQLYIDTVAFQGAWNRKFDWKGELMNTFQVLAWMPHKVTRPDGTEDFIQGANMAFQCAESMPMRRATVAGMKTAPNAPFDSRVVFDSSLFTVDSLARFGK